MAKMSMNSHPRGQRVLVIAFALLVITSLAVGSVAFSAIHAYSDARYMVERSREAIAALNEALSEVQDIESAHDGYLLTGKYEFLVLAQASNDELQERLSAVRRLTNEDFEQQRTISGIETISSHRAEVVRHLVAQRIRPSELQSLQTAVIGSGSASSRQIKLNFSEIKAIQEQQLSLRNRAASSSEFRMKISLSLLVSLLVLFMVGSYVLVRRDYAELRARELELTATRSDLERANAELQSYLAAAKKHAHEMELLNQLGKLLQSSASTADAYDLFRGFFPKLFPEDSGVLMTISSSHKIVGTEAVAGNPSLNSQVLDVESCWALRRGQPYSFDLASGLPGCRHMETKTNHVCFPLASNGQPIGLLQIQSTNPVLESKMQLVATFADEFGLALGNLRLRESLREQSIRDPLTGLFNRRYMEETLERELARAKRSRGSVAVVMLDLDHFKKLNDRHGHQFGDKLLREVGKVLRSTVRIDDISCRYGGEEFTVVMPGADMHSAQERCEAIRQAVVETVIENADLEPIRCTVSMGLSVYPTHGRTVSRLIRSADQALYRAKANGRDRIEMAHAELESLTSKIPQRPGLPM